MDLHFQPLRELHDLGKITDAVPRHGIIDRRVLPGLFRVIDPPHHLGKAFRPAAPVVFVRKRIIEREIYLVGRAPDLRGAVEIIDPVGEHRNGEAFRFGRFQESRQARVEERLTPGHLDLFNSRCFDRFEVFDMFFDRSIRDRLQFGVSPDMAEFTGGIALQRNVIKARFRYHGQYYSRNSLTTNYFRLPIFHYRIFESRKS